MVLDHEAIQALANVDHRNRISRACDVVDNRASDRGAQLRQQAGGSAVDATVAQAAEAAAGPFTILSSDSNDMRRLATFIEGDT